MRRMFMETLRRRGVGAMRRLRGAILVLAAALAHPCAVAAQTVVGTVVEEGSARVVVGALVRLVTPDGQNGPLYLTASDGSYRLTAPSSGLYHVLVERIGFASSRLGPIEIPASGTLRFDISLTTAPVRLEGLEVGTAERACQLDLQAAAATQLVWDEARKALAAATWTERQNALQFRLRTRLQELAPRGLSVVEETHSTRTVWSANSVRSLPPEDLVRDGYVRARADGEIDYFAPDAEVLLSDEFLDTHCLHLSPAPRSEAHLVGLSFEPVPDRDTTDVAGTLWLDGSSGRLDRLEFHYTGLSIEVGDEFAQGEVHFEELSDGHWIVSDWFIRAPVVGVVRGAGGSGTFRRPMLTSVMETGTEVVWARGAEVEWSADLAALDLEGTVYDSVAGAPLVGAEVRLAGRAWADVTDSLGRFDLHGVPEGTYRIVFDHPKLDSLGIEPGWSDVRAYAAVSEPIRLAIPSMERIVALGCPNRDGVLVGQVVDAGGARVPGAAVRVVDGGSAREGLDSVAQSTDLTDSEGWFRLCGLVPGAVVQVEARIGALASNRVEAQVDPMRLDRVLIELDLARGASVPQDNVWGVFGVVSDVEGDRPLTSVTLALLDESGEVAARAVTDGNGRFLLEVGRRGDYQLRAERIGYASLESQSIPLRGRSQQVEVRLAPEAFELQGVVVSVESRVPHLERNGFYRREFISGGHFLTSEDIDLNRPQRTTDILYRLPSVQRLDTSRDGNTTSHRVQLRGAVRGIQRSMCLPAIYVDGALARPGFPDTGAPPRGYPAMAGLTGFPTIDDLVTANEVEAIEVYETTSTLPVQFTGPGSVCGAIVIWRRRGPGG